jgi:hypothetical protein
MPSPSEQPTTHAACSVCGVTYIEGYEGPCTEFLPSATESQIRSGNPPMCPGKVSLSETLARAHYECQLELARLQEENRKLRAALGNLGGSAGRETLAATLYEELHDHELLTPLDAKWADVGSGVQGAFRTCVDSALDTEEGRD